MAVFISRRHACDQAKLVHHSRGRNLTFSPKPHHPASAASIAIATSSLHVL